MDNDEESNFESELNLDGPEQVDEIPVEEDIVPDITYKKEDGGHPCELTEDEAKTRFNLRKRSTVFTGDEDFVTDDDEDLIDVCSSESKKLRLSPHKKNIKRLRPYTNEAVKAAVKVVQTKKMSILEASRAFNIPRTSLHNFVSLYKKGRRLAVQTISPALENTEEKEIVELVTRLCRCGKRYSHNELRFLVQLYLINNDRPVFKSGTLPTMGWIAGLVERHPDLIKAKSKKNTKVAADDVEEWQENISDFLSNDWNMDLDEMFSDKNRFRIFCYSAFRMLINGPGDSMFNKSCVKKEVGSEGPKSDQEVCIILGMSALGEFEAPLMVFSEDHKELCDRPDTHDLKTMYSATGRIEPEVALRVVKELNQRLEEEKIKKPVIYFVNDKQDFAHFSVIEYCWENQICIVCLPPRTVKTMTPFEVNLWPKMRAAYACAWRAATKTDDNKIPMDEFPLLVRDAWQNVKNSQLAVRSFIRSGLIPFDVKAILGDSNDLQTKEDVKPPTPVKEEIKSPIRELSRNEEKTRGKVEGIQMCLEAIESYIPPDILPVWHQREPNYRGRCELAFKLWRSVSLLLKAGIAMASIQQLTEGADLFDNSFGSASFFEPKPKSNGNPVRMDRDPPRLTPLPNKFAVNTPVQTKLKLNRSIYSNSEDSAGRPFVKMFPNSLLLQESEFMEMDES